MPRLTCLYLELFRGVPVKKITLYNCDDTFAETKEPGWSDAKSYWRYKVNVKKRKTRKINGNFQFLFSVKHLKTFIKRNLSNVHGDELDGEILRQAPEIL